ncbi:MAG TPA: SUMF1/EgtB/PvdO family nonheme iron enzyme, partial [Archangium sp.]|nr:SUMF1/EgtB/PvdO family nonheme iron enzyme [Archangium sp.]
LQTARRAVRRQRLLRWLAFSLLILGAGGFYGALRLQAHLQTRRFVESRMEAARESLGRGLGMSQRASASRDKALALFDGQHSGEAGTGRAGQDSWPEAEEAWSRALDELKHAEAAFDETERLLEDALERAHDDLEARQLLIELTSERLLLAERFHRADERARLLERFERLTSRYVAWQARFDTPAVLDLETEPPGASIELLRYVDDDGVRRRKPVPGLGPLGATPISQVLLPPGPYHLRLTREGHAPVELPLLLERGGHEKLRLSLPAAAQVPGGYAYIPPGCFLTGSADPEPMRRFLRSAPLHRMCLQEGYLIGRTEVTLREWMDYLESLPRGARERGLHPEKRVGGVEALGLRQLPDDTWRLTLYLASGDILTARDGEPIRYPHRSLRQEQDWRRFPLAGVSAEDVAGFLGWLDSTGRLPGARLCTEQEWTRAARGADHRRYPHGDRLQKDDANFEGTYGRRPDTFGPDETGAHPVSVSPFGVHDLAGNIFEITRPMTLDSGDIVLRGGAWYYDESGALIANRQAGTSKLRDARVGVRVCASLE